MEALWRLISRILWSVVIVFTLLIIGFGILAVLQNTPIVGGAARWVTKYAKGDEAAAA